MELSAAARCCWLSSPKSPTTRNTEHFADNVYFVPLAALAVAEIKRAVELYA